MIVDDENDILDLLKSVLKHKNYEVITEDSRSSLFKKTWKCLWVIILIDILMIKMNIWDTI